MEIIHDIGQLIYDKKGRNIFAIDVRKVSSTTDYILIAEANVNRHAISIAEDIREELKKKGEIPVHIEGMEEGEWIVLDYVNFMVHIFTPELRAKYQIERLFPAGEIIDIELRLSNFDEKIS